MRIKIMMLRARLAAAVDSSSLAIFRIAFGVLMLWEVSRYFSNDWIQRYYITPAFHFTYYGFGWVRPWPGDWMVVHFYVLGALALCIALGACYRVAAALFFAGFTYVFLLEQARYLNHFYLISLISGAMAIVPAHARLSVDAWRRGRSSLVPAWALWLMRFHVALPYAFGGIAKLNADWVRGYPLRSWLAERSDVPIVGPWLTTEWVVWIFVYGGLLLDLSIVPLLLMRRTRAIAVAFAMIFHVLNANLFTIGVFPPMMMAGTLLFLDPDWPRRLWRRVRSRPQSEQPPDTRYAHGLGPAGFALLAVYVAVHAAVPFRHLLYPGNVAWTEEGHRFSWRMKLREKVADAEFIAVDSAGARSWTVDPSAYLARWQQAEMVTRPDMILQFAHFLGRRLSEEAGRPIGVRARVIASLNGRPPQLLVDPDVDLTRVPRSLRPAPWILPLQDSSPRVQRE